MVVPGSMVINRQAEAEGLDRVFREAEADIEEKKSWMRWRMAGVSRPAKIGPSAADHGGREIVVGEWSLVIGGRAS